MELNIETVEFLSKCFLDSLSPEPESRRRGEKNLSNAADKPNYGLSVLHLVSQPTVDKRIRQFAAVNFKNHLKTRWRPLISYAERKEITRLILSLMHRNDWASTPKIKAELKEAVVIIANFDSPNIVDATVPQLKTVLKKAVKANDFDTVKDVLITAASLFERFRYEDKCDCIMANLKYCLDNFAAPLLTTVKSVSVKIRATAATSTPTLIRLIEVQVLCCRIFYSLNFLELPDVFVYNVDKWMNEFKKYLTVRYPSVEDSGSDGVALVDELRVAVFLNINLYMGKDEKLVQKYMSGFVEAFLSLLVDVSASPNRDRLTVYALNFLNVVSTSINHSLFSGDETLQQITEKVVIPNVMLRDNDEKLFETNYVEFIRRDMVVRDITIRRNIVCDLLEGIAVNYEKKITERLSEQIHKCLALFAENPAANWKYKDCAIYLVVYLSSELSDLVDVESFFISVIEPELQGEDVNTLPMLKASALKFFSLFSDLIPKPVTMTLLGNMARFVGSDVNVVHTYAASCIEKLLLLKDNGEQERFTSVDIASVLQVLMKNLFCALEKPGSGENLYIMRCIMCVFQIADISPEVASTCITRLTTVLNRVCENPKDPGFNRCLFEAIATLVRRACEKNPSLVPDFESWIFPSAQMIQAKEIMEFIPYIFQLFAEIVDFTPPPYSPQYKSLFYMVLKPDMFNTSAYLPAFVRLLQTFIRQTPDELNSEGRLRCVLETFNKLVSSPDNEEHAFQILNPLIENLEYDGLGELMNHIWPSVFTRLQNSKSPMLVKCLIIFLSFFLVKHGIQTLVDSINSVQANLFHVILGQFWIPNIATVTGCIEVKLCAVAANKLLCESTILLNPVSEDLWGKLLDGIVTLLSQSEEKRVEDEYEVLDFGEGTGYRTTFVRLFSAGKKQEDPLKEINDPKHYSVALLANLSSLFPGRFPSIITKYLSPVNQEALLQLCNSYNLAIV